MAAEQDLDRSEAATPYKLKQAREKGQVARSNDVLALGSLVVLLIAAYALAEGFVRDMARLFQVAWTQGMSAPLDDVGRWPWLADLLMAGLTALAPLMLGIVVAAVALALAQSGPVLSTEPLKPDFTRLNPAQGFKKLFSKRVLYEGVKSTLKLAFIGLVTYAAITAVAPGLALFAASDGRQILPASIQLGQGVLAKIVAVVLIVALVDWVYSRWEFAQQMRMSKRDIRDEHKHREGDPRIRAKLRELRIQMLKRSRALRGVKNADVVVTNPTHVAVALSYQPGESLAPKVLAKGAGELAAKIRKAASQSGIPIVQNPPLARALYRATEADTYVPETHYAEVARLMAWVFAMREQRRQSEGGRA